MRLIADAHVHVYPFYNVKLALDNLRRNLAGLDPHALCMAFLAERSDCHFFAGLAQQAPRLLGPSVEVSRHGEGLYLREQGFPGLYIFAGRQIVTLERVEILALTIDANLLDGLPAAETVISIRENGGVPVINWAPGKWLFGRKKVIENLLEQFKPGTILVGDTGLRPRGWLMPRLMKRAVAEGFGLVAGSDPLPFSGEEKVLGKYGMGMDAVFDRENPVESLRNILSKPGFRPVLRGERGGPLGTLQRLIRNSKATKEKGRRESS